MLVLVLVRLRALAGGHCNAAGPFRVGRVELTFHVWTVGDASGFPVACNNERPHCALGGTPEG